MYYNEINDLVVDQFLKYFASDAHMPLITEGLCSVDHAFSIYTLVQHILWRC